MASVSSNSFWKYDVFLSFRGEDTRKNLVSHLHRELERQGISTFKDDEKLARGTYITDELFKAIENSKIAVVIISENYAFSSFCMQELDKIIQCTENGSLSVLPVFYNIDPSDVRKRRGKLQLALEKHRQGNVANLENWEEALTKAASIVGDDSKNWKNDAEMIEKILEDLNSKLNRSLSSDCSYLVGMDTHMKELLPLLNLESQEEVRMIGICGMGGIGKTTLAKYICHTFCDRFQAACFMENVKQIHKEKGERYLQVNFLTQLLEMKEMWIPSYVDASSVIKSRLRHLKVLVILDDVEKPEQLDCLARTVDWFGPGSRIIVTSRDKKLVNGKGCHVYDMRYLEDDDAVKLFCLYAGNGVSRGDKSLELLNRVARCAGGLPLALRVWGSYLCGLDIEVCETALMEHQDNLPMDIMTVLKVSYDALEGKAQDIFLYLACCFQHVDIDWFDSRLKFKHPNVKYWIQVLLNRSLLDLSPRSKDCVIMHDVLVEMGKNLASQPPDRSVGKRQFLIKASEICDVLENETGTDKVEVIDLWTHSIDCLVISKKAFNKMRNLRFLKIKLLSGDDSKLKVDELEYLSSKLVCLEWDHYPLRSLPKGFRPYQLVELRMKDSEVERLWEGGVFPYLKIVNLRDSRNLKQCPDLSTTPNLETLVLSGCSALVELCCSIELPRLAFVDLAGCDMLKNFPPWQNMKALEILDLRECKHLKKFPKDSTSWNDIGSLSGLPRSLQSLWVSGRLSRRVKNTLRVSGNGRLETGKWDWDEFPNTRFQEVSRNRIWFEHRVHIRMPQNCRAIGLLRYNHRQRRSIVHLSNEWLRCGPDEDEITFILQLIRLDDSEKYDVRFRPVVVRDTDGEEDWGRIIHKVWKETEDCNKRKTEKRRRQQQWHRKVNS